MKHLMWITAVLRIKHVAQHAHCIKVVFRELFFHKINFLHADAVFPVTLPPSSAHRL